MINYSITHESISAIIDGESYLIGRDNPSYQVVRQAIIDKDHENDIADLFRTAKAVAKYSKGQIEVRDGELYFNGAVIHNVVVDRILDFMSQQLPFEPLIKFLERLMANPSRRAIQELYTFLEHKHLPITPDGFFLGYKGLRDDYTDVHSGTFDNHPGKEHQMQRKAVDDDFRNHCSYGFHVGSLEYATHFGSRVVIVSVDPADVVAVPDDCQCQKLRTCKYKVETDYQGALPRPLHRASDPYDDEEIWPDDED